MPPRWRPAAALSCTALALLIACTASLQPSAIAATGYDTPTYDRFQRFVERKGVGAEYKAFVAYLRERNVADVVPPWTLWREGTDWRNLDTPGFAKPPRDQWKNIVPTLRVLQQDVIPLTGKVEVVSGFRTASYNQRAGGAAGSRHKWFEAVDVVPERAWNRSDLHTKLLRLWSARGPATRMGLGLYSRTRFHVDTHRHRRW